MIITNSYIRRKQKEDLQVFWLEKDSILQKHYAYV